MKKTLLLLCTCLVQVGAMPTLNPVISGQYRVEQSLAASFPMGMTVVGSDLFFGTTVPKGAVSWNNFFYGRGEVKKLSPDGSVTTVASVTGAITSVRQVGENLVAVATSGNGGPSGLGLTNLLIMTGEGVEVSRLTFGYPPSAPNLSLATRSVAEGVELAFVLQANVNDPNLPDIPVQMSGAQTGSLPSGSMYRVVVGQSGSIGFPERLASGIRNAGGVVYDTAGNIWFTDNGHGDSNGVPISRDELNVIPATQVGGEPELFGYPGSYSAQQGGVVGGLGYQPMASFDDAVGASEVIRTPGSFPHQGMLIGFHGKSTVTGVNNLWNPVLLVNIQDGSSMPFILPGQDGSGNLDSFAVVGDALYVAELSEGRYTGDGAIYKITAIPEPRSFVFIPIFLLLVALMAKRRKI